MGIADKFLFPARLTRLGCGEYEAANVVGWQVVADWHVVPLHVFGAFLQRAGLGEVVEFAVAANAHYGHAGAAIPKGAVSASLWGDFFSPSGLKSADVQENFSTFPRQKKIFCYLCNAVLRFVVEPNGLVFEWFGEIKA